MLEELRGRFDAIRDRRDDVTLRIHRALSWAEKGIEASEDRDAACIFYWIAFNAMYARRTEEYSERQEQRDFQQFLDQVAIVGQQAHRDQYPEGVLGRCQDGPHRQPVRVQGLLDPGTRRVERRAVEGRL